MTPNTAHFVHHISRELINDFAGQSIFLYRVNIGASASSDVYSIYNEASTKKFHPPVEVPCLVGIDNKVHTNFEDVDSEDRTSLQAYILRETLKEHDIFPNIGDVILFQQMFFEIYDTDDSPMLHGAPEYKYAVNVMAHIIRRNKYDLPLDIPYPQVGNEDWFKTDGVVEILFNAEATTSGEMKASVITFYGDGTQYVYKHYDSIFEVGDMYEFSVFIKLINPSDPSLLNEDSLLIVGNGNEVNIANQVSSQQYTKFTVEGEIGADGILSAFIASRNFPMLKIAVFDAIITKI
jgi:hypothetical protein